MTLRSVFAFCVGGVLVWTILMAPTHSVAQTRPAAPKQASKAAAPAKAWAQPRTPDGRPDFSGYWSNSTVTPLERPAALGDKEFVTEDDAKALEKSGNRDPIGRPRNAAKGPENAGAVSTGTQAENAGRGGRGGRGGGGGGVGDYNGLWYELGKRVLANNRTSIVVDPPNGRIPPLTREASARIEKDRRYFSEHPADGPESMDNITRCITWITSGPPMLPTFYNNNYQFLQTKGHLAIVAEMIHDARIIPLDGGAHSNVRQWKGDSRGHWEGDTLVIETTNFNGQRGMLGGRAITEEPTAGAPAGIQPGGGGGGRSGAGRPDEKMRVIERFTRTAPDILLYQFTVDDPGTFTKPWSGEIPMRSMEGPLYEYACHEGNYALMDILSGARAEDREALTKGAQK